ncbi:polysaccharide pyruvyl transferase family protein [Microbacterium lacus]|uniref:polysaccharide pyruvyl transferase family protein n=1 Tax=Microbacterium lacus TaxID=415217 RepID=UPI00384A4A81
MKYHHPIRRRLRQARRYAQAAAVPGVFRQGLVIPAHWWDGHPNFGDDLTPWLLPRYGFVPVYRRARDAQLIGVGSILEFVPEDFEGAIWGSGLIREVARPLPRAHVLAVRGALTRDLIGAPASTPLGDPGLLVALHIPRPKTRWRVGVVPHGHHVSHVGLRTAISEAGAGVHVIDVHRSAAQVVREIAACEMIVTTSLHGLVTADSYGVPAVWTTLDPPLEGGDFKFRDYESAVTPGVSRRAALHVGGTLAGLTRWARTPDPDVVSRLTIDLQGGLARLPGILVGSKRYPFLAATT